MLSEDEIREIEDIVGNRIIVLAFLWSKHAKRGHKVTPEFVSTLHKYALPVLRTLEKYKGK